MTTILSTILITTTILSTFLITSIRATEHCTMYLRYLYTTTILSKFLTTTNIPYKMYNNHRTLKKKLTPHIYNYDTFYSPCKKI